MKDGLLLVNLGTPESTSVAHVRKFLRQFLMDPYVLDMGAPWRFLLVNSIIAPFRSKKSAKAYEQIWTDRGSPLMFNSQDVASSVQKILGDNWDVRLAMRYGAPTLESSVEELAKNKSVSRIFVIPLYPQYAWSSTESVIAETRKLLKKFKVSKAVHFLPYYFYEEKFIENLAAKAKAGVGKKKVDHWLMTYHGIPKRHLQWAEPESPICCKKEDCCAIVNADNQFCYRAQCFVTSKLLARKMGLKEDQYTVSFQSRLGRTEWIKPYTDIVLPELAQKGVKNLAAISPSFAVDCLETLEEINIRYREAFLKAGGESFQYVECLNNDESWMRALAHYPLEKNLHWRRF